MRKINAMKCFSLGFTYYIVKGVSSDLCAKAQSQSELPENASLLLNVECTKKHFSFPKGMTSVIMSVYWRG